MEFKKQMNKYAVQAVRGVDSVLESIKATRTNRLLFGLLELEAASPEALSTTSAYLSSLGHVVESNVIAATITSWEVSFVICIPLAYKVANTEINGFDSLLKKLLKKLERE
ncbi:MAG: hypothetical protein ACP5T3_02070 [Candidatus Micrarchaeia archaeon]